MEEILSVKVHDIYRLVILLDFSHFINYIFNIQGLYVSTDEFKSRFLVLDAIYGNGLTKQDRSLS